MNKSGNQNKHHQPYGGLMDFAVIYGVVLGAAVILEYFGSRRMGFMRYLVFANGELHSGLLSPVALNFEVAALVALAAGLLFWKARVPACRRYTAVSIIILTAVLLFLGVFSPVRSQGILELILLFAAVLVAGCVVKRI